MNGNLIDCRQRLRGLDRQALPVEIDHQSWDRHAFSVQQIDDSLGFVTARTPPISSHKALGGSQGASQLLCCNWLVQHKIGPGLKSAADISGGSYHGENYRTTVQRAESREFRKLSRAWHIEVEQKSRIIAARQEFETLLGGLTALLANIELPQRPSKLPYAVLVAAQGEGI